MRSSHPNEVIQPAQLSASRPGSPQMIAGDAKVAVAPLPSRNNCQRFRSFIDYINKRQWGFLGDVVEGRLTYNKQDMSLYDFTLSLKQEFAPKATTTLDIVTTVGGDEEANGAVVARLRVETIAVGGPFASSTPGQHSEYSRHMFISFSNDKITRLFDIWDEDEKGRQCQSIMPPPHSFSPPPRIAVDLKQFYADYIACINGGRMAQELGQFCKPEGVVWNGARMTIKQYGDMMQSSIDAISGLHFHIHTSVVDEGKQQVASRLEFTGVPVKRYAGGVPNGRSVHFSEIVFYWLDQGKISHVLSIVDWEDYRSQLAC